MRAVRENIKPRSCLHFQNTKYKNIVKFTLYFFNHTPAKPHFKVLYLIINPFPYFWFLFFRFDDFKQLLGIFFRLKRLRSRRCSLVGR